MKEALTGVTFPESKRDPQLASQVNFLFFDEKGLSFAYKHWAFLLRDTALPLVRWRDPITNLLMATVHSTSDKGVRLCLCFLPGCNCTAPIWMPSRDVCLATDQGAMKEPEKNQDYEI